MLIIIYQKLMRLSRWALKISNYLLPQLICLENPPKAWKFGRVSIAFVWKMKTPNGRYIALFKLVSHYIIRANMPGVGVGLRVQIPYLMNALPIAWKGGTCCCR